MKLNVEKKENENVLDWYQHFLEPLEMCLQAHKLQMCTL